MTIERNKDLIRRSVTGFYNREESIAMSEIYADGYVGHDPHGFKSGGTAELSQMMDGIYAGFPDFHLSIDELIGEGERVVKRWTVRATHTGDFMGMPATGKSVEFSGTSTYQITDGKLAECWAIADWQTMMAQLGAVPPLG